MAAQRINRTQKRLTPLIALLGIVALMAATTTWLYTSSSPAKADSGPQLHDVDGFYAVPNGDGTWDYVRLDYMMAAGTSDADAAAQAQADAVARFPGAIAVDSSGVSAAYVTTGFKWMAGTTSWSYDATGAPSGVTGIPGALSAAAGTWGAAGANFHFTGGAPSSNGTGACGGGTDGFNTVGWAVQSGAILAVTCSHFMNGSPFGAAVEFDMQIDPGWTWTTGPTPNVDLQSVVTHEMGHALGLGHSADSSAVMFASYTQGTLKRSLTTDDINGELAIYGSSGGGGASPTPSPSPTNTPTNTPTPTKTPTPTNTPTQPAGSPSPSNTPTPTSTQGATNTPTPTTQASPSASATASPTPSMTPSPTPSPTPTNSATPTNSPTPTSVPTLTTPTLPLSPGANLLTWPGATSSPGSALAGELGAIRIIYQWDPVTQTWLRYGPSLPSFVNNLTSLTQGRPYWFIATSAAQVPFVP